MTSVLNKDVAAHIFKHVERVCEVTLPTGAALEVAVARGFIDNNKHKVRTFGSPNTITDVAVDDVCLDIKGKKDVGLLNKISKSANYDKNMFIPVDLDDKEFFIRIPKSIVTQARRPKVDLKGYTADAKTILNEQSKEYVDFAHRTSTKDGCKKIVSIVHLYGRVKGFNISVLSETFFEEHTIETAETTYKKNGKPAAYQGYNNIGDLVYKLSSFNKGSSNMDKRYYVNNVYYRVWKDNPYQPDFSQPILSGIVGNVD